MKYLAEWRERVSDHAACWFVSTYKEFDAVEDALDFAGEKLRNGVAVHLQPIKG